MLDPVFHALNNSTFFVGFMMILLNLGSRYIVHEVSHDDKEYRENIIFRRLAVFAVCFVGTRDIVASLILTAAFIVMSTGLFHNKSMFAREGMTNSVSNPQTSAMGSALSVY